MPKIESAKKALRQNIRRRKQNLGRQQAVKTAIKDYQKSAKAGQKEKMAADLAKVYKTLDKMAKVKLIKKNKADRLKSRLTKRFSQKAA